MPNTLSLCVYDDLYDNYPQIYFEAFSARLIFKTVQSLVSSKTFG